MPVWGVWFDDSFYFSTHPNSIKARNLARNKRLVVHLESGDEAVILEGCVEKVGDQSRMKRFLDEYQAKYGIRPESSKEDQITFRLLPRTAFAWKERNFVASATRWKLQ